MRREGEPNGLATRLLTAKREYQLLGVPPMMDSAEAAKLKALLAELNRLCAEAQDVRQQIDQISRKPVLWPERCQEPHPLSQHVIAHDSPTRTLHGRKD